MFPKSTFCPSFHSNSERYGDLPSVISRRSTNPFSRSPWNPSRASSYVEIPRFSLREAADRSLSAVSPPFRASLPPRYRPSPRESLWHSTRTTSRRRLRSQRAGFSDWPLGEPRGGGGREGRRAFFRCIRCCCTCRRRKSPDGGRFPRGFRART